MTSPLVTKARHVITTLGRDSAEARNAADTGDSGPLSQLVGRSLRAEGAAVLTDPAAREELRQADPALGAELARWLDCELSREAAWRADCAAAELSWGDVQVDLSALEAEGASADHERSSAAWAAANGEWRARVGASFDWRSASAPARPKAEPPEPSTTSSGGLFIPSQAMIAAVGSPQIVAPDLFADPATSPATSAVGPLLDEASLLSLMGVARELARGLGVPFADFAGARRAGAASGANFELRTRRTSAALPSPRPGLPILRGGRVSRGPRHWGRSTLIELSATGPLPLAAAAVGRPFVRWELDDPGAEPLAKVRGLALAFVSLVIDAGAAQLAEARQTTFAQQLEHLGLGGVPAGWAEVAGSEAALERRPGEESALYLRGSRLLGRLCDAAASARAVRDLFDEDWFREPDRVVAALAKEPLDTVHRGLEAVLSWLVEAAEL